MANFTLSWTPNINSNVSAQRTYYRQKSVGGAFLTTGFTPTNDLPTTANTTSITGLLDNTVYEFQVANICVTGGPVFNINGIQEAIKFACRIPTESHTDTTATVSVTSLPTDITTVRYSLLTSGGVLISGPFDITTSGGSASRVFTGLSASTSYIVRVEYGAVVNGTLVFSNLGNCQIAFTTNAPTPCIAPIELEVTVTI